MELPQDNEAVHHPSQHTAPPLVYAVNFAFPLAQPPLPANGENIATRPKYSRSRIRSYNRMSCCDLIPFLDFPVRSSPFIWSCEPPLRRELTGNDVLSFIWIKTVTESLTDTGGRAMAPTNVSHKPNDFLYALLPSFVRVERRDGSQDAPTPSSTLAGFAAAIAILGAIILGYAVYRGFKWHRARHHPPATSPSSIKSSRFKQNGPAEINIANSNYIHFAAMSQTQPSHTSPRHDQDTSSFSPLPQTANGTHTPHLDWHQPVLTPWSKNGHPQGGSDSPSYVVVNRAEMAQVDSISYPSQTYSTKRKRRGTGGVFGFMRSAANGISGGRKSAERSEFGGDAAYLMVHGSPPISSPPTQFLPQTADGNSRDPEGVGLEAGVIGISRTEESGKMFRSFGGATSPPLPPLPQRTSIPLDASQQAVEKAMQSSHGTSRAMPTKLIPTPINLAPPPPSATSCPPSRVPTTKSHRLTATSSLNGHGAVPSPRVSSLFHASSRLSHNNGYTPASPGLPNPPLIPPIPAFPAHLFRLPSMSKTVTSTGSTDTHTKHDSAISTSTAHGGDTGSDVAEDPTKGPDGKPLPRTMVVTCTFTPSLSDELPLTIGETVSMLEEYIDEWCFVQRVRVMVKGGGSRAIGGVIVSVHGTVDAQNTTTVPVAGEGNLGAVPRFCLSEWPLAIPGAKGEEQAVTLGQETPTGLPIFTPPAFLPSPPSSSTTPTFTPGRVDVARRPLLSPTMATREAQPKTEVQPVRPRPLPTPTPKAPVLPEQPLDSKFSSWGSAETQTPMPMPDASHLRMNQNASNANSSRFQTLSGLQPPSESQRLMHSTHPLSSSTSSQVPAAAGSTSSHIHPLANHSRTPSFSSAGTSIAALVVPPTSPDSQSPWNGSPVEDDNIRRVSKPPLAPRLSRFPPTPDYDEHVHIHGHSRNPSREGGVPRAAERTVTMPPLPRRPSASDPSTAESPSPTQQQNNPPINSTVADIKANTHWGDVLPPRENFPPTMTPSTSTDAASTGMGTSLGSKTPSTAATSTHSSPAVKGASPKRFTASAEQVSRSGSLNNIQPSSRTPKGAAGPSYGGRGPAGPEKKSGPGMINFKALRTGSSTAGVGPVGR